MVIEKGTTRYLAKMVLKMVLRMMGYNREAVAMTGSEILLREPVVSHPLLEVVPRVLPETRQTMDQAGK